MLDAQKWRQLVKCLPSGVNLLAVSKGHPSSSIRSLAELGQIDFGESRLQEALPKLDALKDFKNIRWHFIGRLQSNKVRGVVKSFDVIHSVDSCPLAERISRIAEEESKAPQIFLQVKFLEDLNKGGFAPQDLLQKWPKLLKLTNLKILGLMTMSPKGLDLQGRISLFRNCRDLTNQLDLKDCSMGMSGDWKEAVQEGATWLRLGSSLFGIRSNYVNIPTDITKS